MLRGNCARISIFRDTQPIYGGVLDRLRHQKKLNDLRHDRSKSVQDLGDEAIYSIFVYTLRCLNQRNDILFNSFVAKQKGLGLFWTVGKQR